jgi:integrase
MKVKHPEFLTLREVSKEIAEDYAASLDHGLFSPNTYNKHLNALTLVFRVVKLKAKLTSNPWEDIPRKHLVPHSRRELTVDELKTVCQKAEGELRTLLAPGVFSGMRLGDCATLRWAEVDLARGMIRRIPNKTARRSGKTVIVPIHPDLLAMLAATPAKGRGEYVLPETAALYTHRLGAVTDLVQAHFKACGIKVWKPGTGPESKDEKRAVIDVGFHSLRHTFVSICRESNVPLAVVESIVGHSNPAMTRHYTHVGEGAARLAVAALPSVMGGSTAVAATIGEGAEAALGRVRSLLQTMEPGNWEAKRAEALALLMKSAAVSGERQS